MPRQLSEILEQPYLILHDVILLVRHPAVDEVLESEVDGHAPLPDRMLVEDGLDDALAHHLDRRGHAVERDRHGALPLRQLHDGAAGPIDAGREQEHRRDVRMVVEQVLRALVRADLIVAVLDDVGDGEAGQALHAVLEALQPLAVAEDLPAAHDNADLRLLAEQGMQERTGRLAAVEVIAADIAVALRTLDVIDDRHDKDACIDKVVDGLRDARIVDRADDQSVDLPLHLLHEVQLLVDVVALHWIVADRQAVDGIGRRRAVHAVDDIVKEGIALRRQQDPDDRMIPFLISLSAAS